MFNRFEKLVDAHPLSAMFKKRLNLSSLKKELIRRKKKTAFVIVKQFLLADRFNPVLFLEMKRNQCEMERISRPPAYHYIWESLLIELIGIIDYQTIDQFSDILAITENSDINGWLSNIRKAVGKDKYIMLCRLIAGIARRCESIESLHRFLEYYIKGFGNIYPISESIRIFTETATTFCTQLNRDGDDPIVLDAWVLMNRLLRKKHRQLIQSLDVTVLFSHLNFLKNLLKWGLDSDVIYAAFPSASMINLQKPMIIEAERHITFLIKTGECYSPERSEAIAEKLEITRNSSVFHFILRELIIRYTGRVDLKTICSWLSLAEEWMKWENQGYFEYSGLNHPSDQWSGWMELADGIQTDEHNGLLKFISLIVKAKTWQRLVLSHLLFAMVIKTRNPAHLAEMIIQFQNGPKLFFDTIGTCPRSEDILEKLQSITHIFFHNWLKGLLEQYGYRKSTFTRELIQVIEQLEGPDDVSDLIRQLETALSRNVNLSRWLNDIRHVGYKAA